MPSRKLRLYENRIEGIVAHACVIRDSRLYHRVTINTPREIRIELRDYNPEINPKVKEKPGLLIFNFTSGITSCQVAGNHKYNDIGNIILDEIEEKATLQSDFGNKEVSFHGIEQGSYDTLKELLKEEPNLTISALSSSSPIVLDSFSITGPYNSHITITYYNTKTLLLQGSISSLFVAVFTYINECVSSDNTSLDGTFISFLQHPVKEWISSDFAIHFPDTSKFTGTCCETLIKTSISLLNSEISVGDYSSMTHGIFRAMEIIIGKKIAEVAPYSVRSVGTPETIGRDFNNSASPRTFKTSFTYFDSNPTLKSALENAYNHFCTHRHSTFHSDLITPMNTVVISQKEDAIDLAVDSILLIRRIIDNW